MCSLFWVRVLKFSLIFRHFGSREVIEKIVFYFWADQATWDKARVFFSLCLLYRRCATVFVFQKRPVFLLFGPLVCFWRTLVLWTQSALAVAHRVKSHRIRYVFRFSEETSELYRLLLELNDFSAFWSILFLCFTNVRLLARWCPWPPFFGEYIWSGTLVLLRTARLRSTDMLITKGRDSISCHGVAWQTSRTAGHLSSMCVVWGAWVFARLLLWELLWSSPSWRSLLLSQTFSHIGAGINQRLMMS